VADLLTQLNTALAGEYRLDRELGRGGMATVYLAHDLKHDRKVALKVLHPELAATLGPDRFLREIKVAANLQHPHILPVHDSESPAATAGTSCTMSKANRYESGFAGRGSSRSPMRCRSGGRSPTPWAMPTAGASSTGILSRRTSSSPADMRWWRTSGLRAHSTAGRRR
jgi:serine/threonine protein kinase